MGAAGLRERQGKSGDLRIPPTALQALQLKCSSLVQIACTAFASVQTGSSFAPSTFKRGQQVDMTGGQRRLANPMRDVQTTCEHS